MRTLISSTLIVLSCGLLASTAVAQSNCAAHELVVERLASGYGESRQSIGLGSDGSVVETFNSLETRTWTITVTTPGGPTCLVASGEHFALLSENIDPDA